jgi:hypothetical protein
LHLHRLAKGAAVVVALLVTVLGPVGQALATTWDNDKGFTPYGTTSMLQKPLPTNAPVSPDNAYFQTWIKANEPVDFWKVRGASGTNYGENFARGVCTDPVFKLAPTATVPPGQEFLRTSGVHAPLAVFEKLTQSNDNPVVIQIRRPPRGVPRWWPSDRVHGHPDMADEGRGTSFAGLLPCRVHRWPARGDQASRSVRSARRPRCRAMWQASSPQPRRARVRPVPWGDRDR